MGALDMLLGAARSPKWSPIGLFKALRARIVVQLAPHKGHTVGATES